MHVAAGEGLPDPRRPREDPPRRDRPVARRGSLVAFVDVKYRRSRAELDFAIDEHRLSRVAAAVECIAHIYAGEGDDIRIDVILLAPGRLPRHIATFGSQ